MKTQLNLWWNRIAASLTGAALLALAVTLDAASAGDSSTSGGPIQLIRVSPSWPSPAVGAIGLPSLSGGMVRFATEESLYEGPPLAVRPALRTSTWVPERTDPYAYFQKDGDRLNYDLSAGDRGVTFVGRSRRGELGIYSLTTNRQERAWVRSTNQIPGGTGVFTRLQYPSTRGEYTVFVGSGEKGQKGVYLASKSGIQAIADVTTNAPGSDHPFHDFSYVRTTSDGTVFFTGYSSNGSGIFRSRQGELTPLITRQTIEPRTKKPYSGALLIGQEDDWVYFTSFGGSLSIGRVRTDGSSLETLVNDANLIPGSREMLGAINYASVDRERIVFEAATQGQEFNLYLWEKGAVRTLVRHGDPMLGGKITLVRSGLQALEGNRFACLVDIQNEGEDTFDRAVYVGELTPGSMSQAITIAKKSEEKSWFRLGFGPIPVFARQAATNNEATPVRLSDAK